MVYDLQLSRKFMEVENLSDFKNLDGNVVAVFFVLFLFYLFVGGSQNICLKMHRLRGK